MAIGGFVGSALPMLWNGGLMAYTLWSGIGGFFGIYVGYKLARTLS